MRISPTLLFGLIMTGTSLGGCSRQPADDVLAADQLTATRARPEDRFGKGFGEAFRADPKSVPREVRAGDVVAVSTTAEPIEID